MLGESLINKLNLELESAGYAGSFSLAAPEYGGDINKSYRLESESQQVFVKVNSAKRHPGMFEAELKGLELLRETGTIRVPKTIAAGAESDDAYLLLEYLKTGARSPSFWVDFGRSLASLHRTTQEQFGLNHENYIGSLPQRNRLHDSWAEFFVVERLEAMLSLALNRGEIPRSDVSRFERFFSKVEQLFPIEPPSLVHGDLWNGNFSSDELGNATIYDPAVYYGHREMDIGMSKLFGGFSNEFYDAYNEEWAMESGWEDRVDICNLYPLLVHVNLFGGGYYGSVKSILSRHV